jgi:hypothetical protein
MRLCYLGQAFECSTRDPQIYRQPYAVNWRYQLPGEVYGEKTSPNSSNLIPKAVSWRWQVPAI